MADRSGLTWALKESLIAYVEGLDDGNAEALAPAVRSGAAFTFPWDGASRERSAGARVGTWNFWGAVPPPATGACSTSNCGSPGSS